MKPAAAVAVVSATTPADLAEITALHDRVFGPGAYARTAYRVRECAPSRISPVCLVSRIDGDVVAAVRFTPITIGGRDGALLLGPLCVATARAGQGFGKALVAEGLERARAAGMRLILLVGNESYYARFGFARVPIGQITMPGPVDLARLLAAPLEDGALGDYRGLVAARAATAPAC